MMCALWILLGMITLACWILALVIFRGCYSSPWGLDKADAKLILGLTFWPIGFVIVIVSGFSKLFKTAFGKEEY